MTIRSFTARVLTIVAVCATGMVFGQLSTDNSKVTIGVGPVKVTPALQADMNNRGKGLVFDRVTQSMDGHITSTLVQMRKFQVVAGSDLNDIFQQGVKGDLGVFDPATVPEAARIKLPKYMVITTVDSFLEENATATFRSGTKTKRRFQLSAQAKIYDTATGEILESSNLQVERVDVLDVMATEVTDAKRTDEMMPLLARELAEKVALRTADVVFPGKIIDIDGEWVTINRGDGFGLKVGDIMDVYGPSREIKDPDSGAVIRRKGRRVGTITITEVEPTYAQGTTTDSSKLTVGSVVTARAVEEEDE